MISGLYFKNKCRPLLTGLLLSICSFQVGFAQVYTDTTGLISDLEAGIFEEYILAPQSVTDTFFIKDMISIGQSFVLKAQDGLGFKPVVAGNPDDKPSYLFSVEGVPGGAEITLQGIHFVSEVRGSETINNGTMRVLSENVDLNVINSEFFNFPSFNAVVKVYNSGGNITFDSVTVYNCRGKIIQVNYKDDDDTPNYVPLIGDVKITNSTFAKVYDRVFFELGAGDVSIDENDPSIKQRFNAGANSMLIDHCTFYDHPNVNLMQGRSLYEFAGHAAIKNKMEITNTIFSRMGKNMALDSAANTILEYSYLDFGHALEADETLEDFSKYNPSNMVETAPIFADTTVGAWDLTLQNEADIFGSDERPIGDPRWWKEVYTDEEPVDTTTTLATGDELLQLETKIYGTDGMLVIDSKVNKAQLRIYNMSGLFIGKHDLAQERIEINLKSGIYIVRFYDMENNVIENRKVLITK